MKAAHGFVCLAASIGFLICDVAVQPAGARGGPDEVQFGRHRTPRTNIHVRYPGDLDVGTGTVRNKSPEKGPYIERCHWIAKSSFFGFPTGYTQRCVRYTN